jgi:hypothetical protein
VRDGGPHRLGSGNNRRGSEHRGPARDRRPRQWALGSRAVLVGLYQRA